MSKPTYDEMRTRAQRIYDDDVKAGVLAGIKVLQKEYGDEWVDKINCDTLDLSEGAQCVLGQVCGDFDYGVEALTDDGEYDLEWAQEHGFYSEDGEYEKLDEAWHAVLCDKEHVPGGTQS